MKPVEQTLFAPHNANCFPACLASLLEVPLELVPHPSADETCDAQGWAQYQNRLSREFLWPRNLHCATFAAQAVDNGEPICLPGYAIATGMSPRTGGLHSVISYDGDIVWDPHPEREKGLGEITEWTVFVALDPAASMELP